MKKIWRRKAAVTMSIVLGLLIASILTVSADEGNGKADKGSVTFAAKSVGDAVPQNPRYSLELHCDDGRNLKINLRGRDSVTRNHHSTGQLCTVRALEERSAPLGSEVHFKIRQDDHVLAQRIVYPESGTAESTEFYLPDGETTVEVTYDFTTGELGTRLRVMAWNIWGGGREAGGEDNVRQLIELIRSQNPDILFTVETYESGDKILEGLNEGQPEELHYNAIQVSNEPRLQPDNDNLWIFSRLPVVKQYPLLEHPRLSSFHFGGAKVQLPDGQELNLFNTWIYHGDVAWNVVNQTVKEIKYDLPRSYTNAEILATDLVRRLEMIRIILDEHLPEYLEGDSSPVIMAGDFNTLSSQDWSSRFAEAPGHGGLVLQWPVTTLIQEAGFTDSYRWANPDAGKDPGNTWSPHYGYDEAPGRIDYIWTRGESFRILQSYTVDERMEAHQNEEFPFYSDHAAVVTDLLIRNAETLPDDTAQKDLYVPLKKITASASSEHAGYEADKAVDGDLKTMWHTEWSPPSQLPQSITLDLGEEYPVNGLSYRTRTDFKPDGIITEYKVYTSADGTNFTKVAAGSWETDYYEKTVRFDVTNARYIKLEALSGSGGYAAASEIKVSYKH